MAGKRSRTASTRSPTGTLQRVRAALVNSPPGQALRRLRHRRRRTTRNPVVDVSSEEDATSGSVNPPTPVDTELVAAPGPVVDPEPELDVQPPPVLPRVSSGILRVVDLWRFPGADCCVD